jgi:hypothetical protein
MYHENDNILSNVVYILFYMHLTNIQSATRRNVQIVEVDDANDV